MVPVLDRIDFQQHARHKHRDRVTVEELVGGLGSLETGNPGVELLSHDCDLARIESDIMAPAEPTEISGKLHEFDVDEQAWKEAGQVDVAIDGGTNDLSQ